MGLTLAIGASYRPFDGTLLAADYWNGEAEGDAGPGLRFDVDVDRWNFGVQQRLCDCLDIRLGSNNGGFTTGFSVHVKDSLDIDYAYVNEAIGDKENVWGDTEYHGVSVSYRF